MDLDIAVNRQLHGGMSALSQEHKDLASEDTDIPTYFDYNDVRKPASVYVEDRLRSIIQELFSTR